MLGPGFPVRDFDIDESSDFARHGLVKIFALQFSLWGDMKEHFKAARGIVTAAISGALIWAFAGSLVWLAN